MHDRKIPVMFQMMEDYKVEDTRFVKTKIWLMHTGENFNGSHFSKEVVEKAIPTLANTPILGFAESNEDDEDDFSDHRADMEKDEDGNWKFKYKGSAYGVIPESNNAKFETRLCDDGVEREFLTVEGLLWTKWDTAIDILDRDIVKEQSMELHEDAEGYVDDETGLFHFTDFKFFGSCILGIDYKPAMQNSTVETVFSTEDVKKQIQNKMEEFKQFCINKKGGFSMDEKLELLEKHSKTEEDIKEMGIDLEEITLEELKTLLEEEDAKEDTKEEGNEEDNTDLEEEGGNDIEYKKLYETLEATHNDTLAKIDELNKQIKELEEVNEDLGEFKSNKIAEERKAEEDELFSKYEMLKDVEEFKNIKENSKDFESIADIEKELALVYVKNQADLSFTKQDSDSDASFRFEDEEAKDSRYGDLLDRFGK